MHIWCFELTASRLMTSVSLLSENKRILTLTIFTCINFVLFVVNVPSLGKEAWVVQSSGDDGSGVVGKFGTFDLYTSLLLGLVVVSDLGVNLDLLVDTADNSWGFLTLILGLDVVSFIRTRKDHLLKWRQDEQEVYFTRLGYMTQVEKFLRSYM